MKPNPTMFVFSAGGHYQLFKSIIGEVTSPDVGVTFFSDALSNENFFFVKDASRGFFNLFTCTIQALIVISRVRPKCIVSFGAGVAVPFIAIGAFFRVRVIHVDLPCQVYKPSKTAKIARFFGAELISTTRNQFALENNAIIVDYFDYFTVTTKN